MREVKSASLEGDFGAPQEGPRFQGGIYAQGFWVWDPIQLEIAGSGEEAVLLFRDTAW